jgi:hypothetical protein
MIQTIRTSRQHRSEARHKRGSKLPMVSFLRSILLFLIFITNCHFILIFRFYAPTDDEDDIAMTTITLEMQQAAERGHAPPGKSSYVPSLIYPNNYSFSALQVTMTIQDTPTTICNSGGAACSRTNALNAFKTFYVNKYIDYHAHDSTK